MLRVLVREFISLIRNLSILQMLGIEKGAT